MQRCVWYISKYVTPANRGSAGTRGYYLMRELVRLGCRVAIITSDSNQHANVPSFDQRYLLQSIDGIDFWWIRTCKYTIAKSLRRILSWLDFEFRLLCMPKSQLPKPDVLIVSSLSLLTIFNGFILKRKYQCRLVFEVRDIWPLTIVEEGGFKRHNPLIWILGVIEKLGYRNADVIVGTMPNLGEHVLHTLNYRKATECIPMGFSPNDFNDAISPPDEYVTRYINHGKFIVAYAGTVGITNALETFFNCAESLSENARIEFLIIGDGDLREHFQARYGHLPNVTFAPKVDKQLVPAVLSRCDLLYFSVKPSGVWRFGQSLNKLIDYMLAGRPIIASYSGYPSMINESGCGCFVPADDLPALREEILRFSLMSPSNRNAIGEKGRKWLMLNRSYEKLALDYHKILFP